MLEILSASRFPELRPLVDEFCKNLIDNFTKSERLYSREHGIYHEIVAVLRASEYLKRIAQIQKNDELVQSYNTKIRQYDKELKRLLYTKRW